MDRAVLESKTVQVQNSPSAIDDANRRYGLFFWAVQSTQITDTKNTSFTDLGDTILQKVEHTNYATITYTRDKTMPRYDEITAIEKELEDKEECRASELDIPMLKPAIFAVIGVIVVLIGILAFSYQVSTGIFLLLVGAVLFFIGIRMKKNNDKLRTELHERWTSSPTIEELLQNAQALNNEIIAEMRKSRS